MEIRTFANKTLKIASALSMIAYSACTGSGGKSASVENLGLLPKSAQAAEPAGGQFGATLGPSCHSDNPDKICLALKYVAYIGKSGKETVTQDQVIKNVGTMNKLFDQCNVNFQVDQYAAIKPEDLQLTYDTADQTELNDIRKKLEDDKTLLVVTTGEWDRNGTLGNTGANAWTNMPGEGTYGAVLEDQVATFGNIIAHEVGHYLNLDHADDKTQLMNPVIYDNSTVLTADECKTVRETATTYWANMIR